MRRNHWSRTSKAYFSTSASLRDQRRTDRHLNLAHCQCSVRLFVSSDFRIKQTLVFNAKQFDTEMLPSLCSMWASMLFKDILKSFDLWVTLERPRVFLTLIPWSIHYKLRIKKFFREKTIIPYIFQWKWKRWESKVLYLI